MNLHSIAAPYVAAVNPWMLGNYQQSNGYQTNGDGSRSPQYLAPAAVQVQMQAMTFKDLMQLQGLNINGVKSAMYVTGNWEGIDRPNLRGGDLITISDGSIWLVVQVLENWNETSGWTKVGVVLQDGS